jgi:hypothetical protein
VPRSIPSNSAQVPCAIGCSSLAAATRTMTTVQRLTLRMSRCQTRGRDAGAEKKALSDVSAYPVRHKPQPFYLPGIELPLRRFIHAFWGHERMAHVSRPGKDQRGRSRDGPSTPVESTCASHFAIMCREGCPAQQRPIERDKPLSSFARRTRVTTDREDRLVSARYHGQQDHRPWRASRIRREPSGSRVQGSSARRHRYGSRRHQ